MNRLLSALHRLSIISLIAITLIVSSAQPAKADPAAAAAAVAAQVAASVAASAANGWLATTQTLYNAFPSAATYATLLAAQNTTRVANTALNTANRAVSVYVGAPINNLSALVGIGLSSGHAAVNSAMRNLLGVGACKGNGNISDVICNVMDASSTLPGFLTAIGYISGLILTISGLFKLKDHVLNSNNTPLSDSMKRFLAAGALFTLPLITQATQNMLTDGSTSMSRVSAYAGYAGSNGAGLDSILVALFADIYAPLISIILGFAYLAGIILVMVGISRIIKTAQDGPRGPAGMGTIMTFVIAGVLFSLSTIMGTFSGSMFDTSKVATFAVLSTTTGDVAVDDHILAIISTVLVFMTIIGYISFMRGFFMIKDVAEGNSQASLMAGVTHIFGGALAVNLGPLMNAVQRTLGLDTLGVMFY